MKIIALEGIDGSGKTTMANQLTSWLLLQNYSAKLIIQPTQTLLGKTLRKYLRRGYQSPMDDKAFALMFAANRVEMLKEYDYMKDFRNPIIVHDRCLWSNWVYSDLSRNWFEAIEKFCEKPDTVILLDLDPEVALERSGRKDAYETLEKLQDARKKYLFLAEDMGWIVVSVDGLTQAEVLGKIIDRLLEEKVIVRKGILS